MQKDLKIGIDARLLTYRRGIGNFIYNIINELVKLPLRHHFFLYIDDAAALQLLPAHPRVHFVLLKPKFYPLWEQFRLPQQIFQDQLDILYCPANTAPLIIPTRTRLIVNIHDVMYLLPNTVLPPLQSRYQRWGKRYRALVVPRIAPKASLITTISEYSRSDLLAQLKVDPNRVKVIYLAHGSNFRKLDNPDLIQAVREKFNVKEKVVFVLGAIDPRKNTARAIEAFAQFKTRINEGYQLVIAGLDKQAKLIFEEQANKLNVLANVILLDFITEEELIALYNIAEMVLYPSLYEGFGLPVLEAMACGAPVITSHTTSMPEIARDAALLIDPLKTNEITDAMLQIATNRTLKLQLIQQGLERVKKFSWSKAAQELLTVFEEVVIQ